MQIMWSQMWLHEGRSPLQQTVWLQGLQGLLQQSKLEDTTMFEAATSSDVIKIVTKFEWTTS